MTCTRVQYIYFVLSAALHKGPLIDMKLLTGTYSNATSTTSPKSVIQNGRSSSLHSRTISVPDNAFQSTDRIYHCDVTIWKLFSEHVVFNNLCDHIWR